MCEFEEQLQDRNQFKIKYNIFFENFKLKIINGVQKLFATSYRIQARYIYLEAFVFFSISNNLNFGNELQCFLRWYSTGYDSQQCENDIVVQSVDHLSTTREFMLHEIIWSASCFK